MLVLVYRKQSSGAPGISSMNGGAISSTNQVTAGSVATSTSVFAWTATGTGSSANVTVLFGSSANVTTTIDVVQLYGDDTANPIAASASSSGSSGTATGGSLSGVNSSDGEVFFVGLSASTTLSTPSGYTALDAPASGYRGSWFRSSASSSGTTTTLGTSTAWATIELAILP